MADDRALRRLVVVRRDREDGVHAEIVRLTGQLDRVRGVVRPGVGDDAGPVADRLHGGGEELELLLVGEGRSLPRRAGYDEAVGAVLDEVDGEAPEAVHVDRPVLVERGDDRGQDFAEHGIILREHVR